MSNHKLLILFLTISLNYSNLFAKNSIDTTTVYYTANWQPTHFLATAYYSKQWVENGLYFRNDYYYPSMILQMTGSYSDTTKKVKEGLFVYYYGNGVKKDSTFFKTGKEEGISIGWYENGQLANRNNYKKGILIDTSYSYYYKPTSMGHPLERTICDEKGNGSTKFFSEDGKETGGGNMVGGKKNGKWTFVDKNGIVSQMLVYEMDSVMQITNFDENGKLETVNKTLKKAAEFPGGLKGWRRFLEENLQYPKYLKEKVYKGLSGFPLSSIKKEM